jgi:acyl dehydratase
MSIATGLANQLGDFEGTTIAVLNMNVAFKGAVKPGDTITLKLVVGEKKESSKPDRGIIIFNNEVVNQNDEVVLETQWTIMMNRKQ